MNTLAPVTSTHLPTLVAAAGARASYRFLEFFTANIRNPHTRRACARAAKEFFAWLEARGVTRLAAIGSVHVAIYVEQLQRARSAPTAKLRLAALRRLFDWMVIGQISLADPHSPVRGPAARNFLDSSRPTPSATLQAVDLTEAWPSEVLPPSMVFDRRRRRANARP